MAGVLVHGWSGSSCLIDWAVSGVPGNVWGGVSDVPEHGWGDENVFEGIARAGSEYSAVDDRWDAGWD